jgi:transcription elongation factor Elf1
MTLHRRAASRTEPRSKTTLFCPECGHESDVAGDWIVRDGDAAGGRTHTCPECGTAIEGRRRSEPVCA